MYQLPGNGYYSKSTERQMKTKPSSFKALLPCALFCFVLLWDCSNTKPQGDSSIGSDKAKPNVLILLSDQHNKKVMGFEGHPDVITPNLDKLAEQSLVFNKAYCNTGVCTPSRSALL